MAIRLHAVSTPDNTPNRVAIFDPASGVLTVSTVTNTELLALSGISGTILTTTNAVSVSNKTNAQDIVFDANNTRDIGSSGIKAKNAYLAGQVNTGTLVSSSDITVGGNLTVNGTTTTLNTATLDVADKNITVSKGGNDAASEGAGLSVDRTSTKGSLIYAAASATKFRAGDLASEVDLVGTTSTQTLTNKTLVAASNTVTTAASGNLTATDLNGALAQLQTHIDAKIDSSANLSALSALDSGTGIVVETAANTFAKRSVAVGSTKLSLSNPAGVAGNITLDVQPGNIDVATLSNLTADTFTQYALLAGRSGGQTLDGDTAASGNLTLSSTAHATKGKVLLGAVSIALDEANTRVGIGTTSPSTKLHIKNTADDNLGGIRFQPVSGSEVFDLYTSGAGTLLLRDTFQGETIWTVNNQGRMGIGGAAIGHPDATLLVQNQSSITAIPTLAFKKQTSQTAEFLVAYDTDESTKLASISIAGKGTFSSLTDSGLSTGIVHSDSSGNFTSSAVDVSSADVTGTLAAARFPALTGNVTTSAGSLTTTIAALAVTNSMIAAATIDLTAKVTGLLPIANGGTGQTSKSAAFDALQPMTTSGDIIYGGTSGTGTRLPKGSDGTVLTLASGIPSWAAAAGGSTPTSEVTVDSGNGSGSTNTQIRRFSNTRKNVGSDITYADSATLGGSFTIVTAGIYSITYHDTAPSGVAVVGITVNDSAMTTDITPSTGGITYAQGLRAVNQAGAVGFPTLVSWCGHLAINDVIRAHFRGANATDSSCMLTIIRVS